MQRRVLALVAVLVPMVLFACTARAERPVASEPPVLPFRCTPTAWAPVARTPYPCSSQAHQKQQEQDALEAEAVAVHNRFVQEYLRLKMAGGSEELTPELEAVLEDPIRSEVKSILATQKTAGRVYSGPAPRSTWKADRHTQLYGSVMSVQACEDYREVVLTDRGGQNPRNLGVMVGIRYLKRFDGVLKVFYSHNRMERSCLI